MLPDYIRPFPTYLRQSGYYCSNNRKQDYQFNTPEDAWDESSGGRTGGTVPRRISLFLPFSISRAATKAVLPIRKNTGMSRGI